MAKNIIFCSDGTWDTAAKNSNVYRIYKAMPTTSEQLPFYDDGVGSDGIVIWKTLGGAFGTGLWQKIKDGYTKIAHAYEKGDAVFLFGFSRGAYTARSIAGMIAACGLPTKNFSDDLVNAAFDAYRERNPAERAAKLAKLQSNEMDNAKIKMIGVWDTVGSLGIPSLFGAVDPVVYGFLDTKLHPDVENAYHALAIDEKRAEFPATLWEGPTAEGQTLEQVWFTGVHSDVGGGEPEDPDGTALSDITLGWMMSKAAKLGLTFDTSVLQLHTIPMTAKYALDTLHTSWKIYMVYWKHREVGGEAVLANSVRLRCLHDNSYRPPNLKFEEGALAAGYGSQDVVSALEAAQTAGG